MQPRSKTQTLNRPLVIIYIIKTCVNCVYTTTTTTTKQKTENAVSKVVHLLGKNFTTCGDFQVTNLIINERKIICVPST